MSGRLLVQRAHVAQVPLRRRARAFRVLRGDRLVDLGVLLEQRALHRVRVVHEPVRLVHRFLQQSVDAVHHVN
ncbi:transcriptional regulator, GntR family [Burkholderia pseudomallei]|nr:transcriptional regulator, GntR family [Burkholderia pseudomallei]